MQVHRECRKIRAKGAELALVGNGSRPFARAFRDDLGITAPLYVDVERRAYDALGMKKGVGSPLGLASTLKNAARAWRGGFRQSEVQGDAWQLGGVLVVRPGGKMAYRYLSRVPGDHPPVSEILAAL